MSMKSFEAKFMGQGRLIYMKTFETKFIGQDGNEFFVQGWEPETQPRAVIALVHGLGEHTGRYAHVAQALTDAGYALIGFDLRGHGKSGGARGHTPSYDALMNDISAFLSMLGEKYPGSPLFLYGHSMGGNQVINHALRRRPKIKAVIVTGPWLKLSFEPPPVKVALGRVFDRIFPSFAQANGLDTNGLSHDPEVIRLYDNDPLNHDRISPRLFVGMYDSGLWALDHAAELSLPLLLMHGGADPVTSAEASRKFANEAGKNVTLKIWDDLYHEIHNEPEQAEVFKVMIEWLDKQL
jgi:alpha-beta hydrolase superfamily lysophospholipase